ncbi:phosphodiester glycosidase family protein [Terricaulis sp.]|uniref:phosphodiester glycosidase family protein n=1 Tax=Terricaulis sp. TaxID=2768686 RepID=UPI003783ECB5
MMKFSRPLAAVGALAAAALIAGVVLLLSNRAAREHERACEVRAFEGSRFTVCAYDAQRDDFRLVSRGADGAYLRTFERMLQTLGRDARRVRFAMNAGMFNDRGAPIGLYVENGAEQHVLRLTNGPGNFHMKPNGVFWIDDDGALHLSRSEDYATLAPHPRFATQSGPMLVVAGSLHPAFAPDGPSRYIRNGVGLRDDRTAYFVISSGAVSFGRFARFFRDELHCRDALFLDGSVSSLYAPSMGRSDDNHDIGPIIVVLDRR